MDPVLILIGFVIFDIVIWVVLLLLLLLTYTVLPVVVWLDDHNIIDVDRLYAQLKRAAKTMLKGALALTVTVLVLFLLHWFSRKGL